MERNICLGVGYNWSFGLRLSTCEANAESTTWAKGNGERWEKPMAIPWFIMFNHVQSFSHENRHKLEYPRFLDHPKFMFYHCQNHNRQTSPGRIAPGLIDMVKSLPWGDKRKARVTTLAGFDDQTMGISSFF